ncbi:cobalamin-binding protein [Anabaenopsis tanganyikae CS-531]|uniref:Cobalamin-binding protein n=2 Tax=Anabaenopsis TaxID=110103 RepID=A0ABT5ATZ1_9CYAN|nr:MULTISPECIES: cobalamin-binding protein [Anabaenopsis]MDB9540760.1 cobalamin-binding protein [Anabaenopsis arnoldii]MDH6093199.1 cobalamin-binding protein [Anabaenopsis arnoldii]MDH6107111.1 cobalamin-binding protein [Anabaenopsis tanganyikae CS-531]
MANSSVRIVSLIPGGTEILDALGLTNHIVGRSHECDYPPEIKNRPVCTQARWNYHQQSRKIHDDINDLLQSALSIYEIKTDVLEKLQPTHIITQDQCDLCGVTLADVEKAFASLVHTSPQIISLKPHLLEDVWQDIERVSDIFGVDSVHVLENLEARVTICQRKLQGLSSTELPTVACIEWTDPLIIAANWIPELVNLAGGQSQFSVKGQPSSSISWEALLKSNPDIIIFIPCGFDLNRTRQAAQLFIQRPDWEKLHAAQSGRVYLADGNAFFNRPGPRLADSLEILAEILHPEIFNYGYKGTAWDTL